MNFPTEETNGEAMTPMTSMSHDVAAGKHGQGKDESQRSVA